MKGIAWFFLYKEFKDQKFEEEITKLMLDDDSKRGIYTYVLTRKERFLNIRAFTHNKQLEGYERQKGICPVGTEH